MFILFYSGVWPIASRSNDSGRVRGLPIGATPQSLIDASLVARNDADIEVLSRAFTGDREGYANTHRQPTAETMTRVAQDFAAAEDDAGEMLCKS